MVVTHGNFMYVVLDYSCSECKVSNIISSFLILFKSLSEVSGYLDSSHVCLLYLRSYSRIQLDNWVRGLDLLNKSLNSNFIW